MGRGATQGDLAYLTIFNKVIDEAGGLLASLGPPKIGKGDGGAGHCGIHRLWPNYGEDPNMGAGDSDNTCAGV